jgi:diguanylate cyclase (GGDEF)-like protein
MLFGMNDLPTPSAVELCRTLLDRIAALEAELAQSRAQISRAEAMAHEDPLTGALNRRGFARELEKGMAFRNRYGTPASIILFDMDGLKTVNDRLGHAAGDALIRGVASTLKRHIRASDSVARLGGDEFAVLVWHADEAVATTKARALQAILDSSSVSWRDGGLPLSASIGVAELGGAMTAEAALTLADTRLYADKSSRRAQKKAA